MSGRRAVFLDRDGVLNRSIVRQGRPYPPSGLAELEILPGVSEACHALRDAGFLLIVVTNQPDVSRGTQTREAVDELNRAIRTSVPLDDVRVCFHSDEDGCDCRKPLPGLLLQAARDWRIDLGASILVGDRWRDIEAGRTAGCRTVLVDHGYLEAIPNPPDFRVQSLADAVPWILGPASLAERRSL